MSNPLQIFRDILTDKGLIPAEIMADGKLHRCPTQTKPHKQNGAYIAHVDIPATLWWCNWEMVNRARSAQKKSKRFPCLNFPHGGNVNTPYSGNAKRNMPNAMLKQLNWPDRNGTRH